MQACWTVPGLPPGCRTPHHQMRRSCARSRPWSALPSAWCRWCGCPAQSPRSGGVTCGVACPPVAGMIKFRTVVPVPQLGARLLHHQSVSGPGHSNSGPHSNSVQCNPIQFNAIFIQSCMPERTCATMRSPARAFSTTCGVCGWLPLASLLGAPPTERTAACSITFGNPAGGSATLLACRRRTQTSRTGITIRAASLASSQAAACQSPAQAGWPDEVVIIIHDNRKPAQTWLPGSRRTACAAEAVSAARSMACRGSEPIFLC